jgi:integrase
VFDLWKVSPKPTGGPLTIKTIETAERIVGQFEKVCGNPPLTKLTRDDGLKFRDWLLTQQSPRTADDRMGYVTRLLRFEMRERQRVTVNPWQHILVGGSGVEVVKRTHVRPEKLKELFDTPLFQSYALPSVVSAGRDAAYWIPILGAHIGARVTELAQLLVTDIRKEDGLWCVSILGDGEMVDWQSIKNAPYKRLIPMHSELIRLGLPEYAEALRAAGHDRLFPMAPVSALNNAGGPFSTWFPKFKTAHG